MKKPWAFHEKISPDIWKNTTIFRTFAPSKTRVDDNRNVAQLVAHYVRDVGVGRSSRLIPTKGLTFRRLSLFYGGGFIAKWGNRSIEVRRK